MSTLQNPKLTFYFSALAFSMKGKQMPVRAANANLVAALSGQHVFDPNRQGAHTLTRRMKDGIGDGWGDANEGDFT